MTGEEKLIMFRNRLTKVYGHLSKIARRQSIACFRIYNHDLPEFPLCIELYGDKIYIAEYKRHHNLSEEAHEKWFQDSIKTIAEVLQISTDNIYTKLRQRKTGRSGQYRKKDNTQSEFIISEDGLQFIVNLSDYLDTGLFLDHRITRNMVREQSKENRVLNLFAYTGSFSVYAAAGGASQVTTVDLSNTYINWAKRNMQLNSFTNEYKYGFVVADVLQYIKTIAPESYDVIVMDPPTFSNSKKMEGFLDIQKDHVQIINDCLKALSPSGILFFSTNYKKFILDKEAITSQLIKDITKATTPFDFEGKLHRYCYRIEMTT
jgi:23S rRNA (cytosine1962-C5)-methyltransferase